MALTAAMPTQGTRRVEDDKSFTSYAGRWRHTKHFDGKWFTSVGDSDPSYFWLDTEEHTDLIHLDGSVFANSTRNNYELGFIAHDGVHTVEFTNTMVPQCYAIASWGGGGIYKTQFLQLRAATGGEGIPLT